MKRILSLLFAILLLMSFVGCTSKDTPAKKEMISISDETSTKETTSGNSSSNNEITKEEAISIALAHAQLEESEVTLLHAEYDFDDGVYKYDVDFRVGKLEYDYEINAKNGDIISFEKDYD